MAKVRIKIDKFGNPTILNVDGAGKNCVAATGQLEAMLGQAAENQRVLTDNYFEEELPPQELDLHDQ